MATYKTKNGQMTGFVPGVGEIVDGKIEGPDNLESANLEKVESQTQVASPAPVAPVATPASQPEIQKPNTEAN